MNFSNMVLGSIYCVTQNETHAYIQSYVNFFSFFFIVNQHTFITELHYLVGIHIFFWFTCLHTKDKVYTYTSTEAETRCRIHRGYIWSLTVL